MNDLGADRALGRAPPGGLRLARREAPRFRIVAVLAVHVGVARHAGTCPLVRAMLRCSIEAAAPPSRGCRLVLSCPSPSPRRPATPRHWMHISSLASGGALMTATPCTTPRRAWNRFSPPRSPAWRIWRIATAKKVPPPRGTRGTSCARSSPAHFAEQWLVRSPRPITGEGPSIAIKPALQG